MTAKEVWTISKLLKWTEEYFGKAQLDSPRLDAEVLLSHVLQKERIYLYVHFDQPLEEDELATYKQFIRRRVNHEPVAYIVGHKEFMGLDFQVTSATLIPRPDTEILVEAALQRLPMGKNQGGVIADIGTGSGAICLSLLKYADQLKAVTVDISPDALAVAKINAEALGVAERVDFRQGDLLAPLQGEQFQAIISNPPYIPEGDIPTLDADVKDYEPIGALVGGKDGFDFYRPLVEQAAALLLEQGFLALEAGIYQAQELKAMAEALPQWGKVELIKDLAGIERVVICWKA